FDTEEEKSLLQESHSQKSSANTLFTRGDYSSAIQGYEKALSSCPTYLEYDIAVLHSNISACHLKLEEWKSAVHSATAALDALSRISPPAKGKDDAPDCNYSEGGVIEEVDEETAVRIDALSRSGKTLNDVQKLRTKALLRRARARREVRGWASLQGAYEDYSELAKVSGLASLDQTAVQKALRELPIELDEAKKTEMADMMGKLKQLGNGILRPFGLSSDNFNFVKDEKSGGYSMQFNRG
ncbi:hypothetical protein GQ43DRAFT_354793, partial [Delitschia confertaspora ATCC 74209]